MLCFKRYFSIDYSALHRHPFSNIAKLNAWLVDFKTAYDSVQHVTHSRVLIKSRMKEIANTLSGKDKPDIQLFSC